MLNRVDEAIELLRHWLSSPQGYERITYFSRQKWLARQAQNGVRLGAFHQSGLAQDFGVDGSLDDVSHDFVEFLLLESKKVLPRQPLLVQALLTGRINHFLELFWKRFCWHVQERSRNKKENPLGHLYRRFREVVYHDSTFITMRTPAELLLYCLKAKEHQASAETVAVDRMTQERYADWPLPPDQENVPLREGELRFATKWLIATAVFFWEQTHERDEQIWWIPVKELVRYLGVTCPWLAQPRIVTASSEEIGAEVDAACAMRHGDSEVILEKKGQVSSISILAAQLVQTWSRNECCVFSWRIQDNPRSFKEIAAVLSLRDHNRAYSMFTKIKCSIKAFCTSWPGPSLEEMDTDIAQLFVENLGKQAKKICDRP